MNNLKVYDSSEQLEGLRFKVVEVLFGNDFLKFKYRKQHVVHNLLFCFQLSAIVESRKPVRHIFYATKMCIDFSTSD